MKTIAAIMLMTAACFAVGCTKPDESNNGTYNGHDYVDLGLPSGTLWATCNVGATTPEGHGDYFAWGETQSKRIYNWETYKYCNSENNQLTKYCYNSSYGYNGFTDNLTILLFEDDFAWVNWGAGWRMPTYEEWMELYQNTTSIWTIQKGMNGRLFTSDNGNKLFLPAVGGWNESSIDDVGSIGSYWSSSLYTYDTPCGAWHFYFISDYFGMSVSYRYCGRPVRAVHSMR